MDERVLVSAFGELALIERIRRRIPPPPSSLIVPAGDDAAVAEPTRGALQVLTADSLVEGVHFDRRFCSAADIGYRALAVNISDVAAMGGVPELALLSLMLPPDTTVGTVDGLIDGILELAAETRTALAGGNITRTPGPLVVDVTVTGSVRRRKVLRRGGGRPGDQLYVTGALGAGAAGLAWLQAHAGSPEGTGAMDEAIAGCVARYRRPEPRARIGALLGRNRAASACMDLSDGLADAVSQVTAASGTGATIDAASLPISPGARAWFDGEGIDPVTAAISRGDDYELLFSVPKRRRGRLRAVMREARGVAITRIGELTDGGGIALLRDGESLPWPRGFSHF